MNLREVLGIGEPEPNDSELSVSPPSEEVSGIYKTTFPRARKLQDESLKLYMLFAGRCAYDIEIDRVSGIELDWEGDEDQP